MSPTEAILRRSVDLSGNGGGSGTAASGAGSSSGAGSAAGGASGGGLVAHAANCSSSTATPSCRVHVRELVTQADPQDVYFCGTQTAAEHIQFIQIVGRADVNTMVVTVIDLYALY